MSTGTPDTSAPAPAASRQHECHLVADVGGTHARFALCTSVDDIHGIEILGSDDFPTMEAAIRQYLANQGNPHVRHAVIGIANPILGDHIKMTNASWEFSIEQLRKALKFENLHVINDFTAQALAIPHLHANELYKVGGGEAVPGAALGVLGPGTGLGVSGLVRTPRGRWIPLAAEGGHVSFAPQDDLEAMLWRAARGKHPDHVSVERLVSGPGLAFIYECLCNDAGQAVQDYSPSQISEHGIANTDRICRLALDTFCAILGTAASDLALTLGARGGIYIGGGIVKKLGDYFHQSPFRTRFEDKGRFSSYLAAIPVHVIDARQPALRGAAAYFETLANE